jgi:hypothetical protein
MLAAWRKHQQQQSKLSAALKKFNHACQALNLVPHEVLQVLTAHLEANGGEKIRQELKQLYSNGYGSHSSTQSCASASTPEEPSHADQKISVVD